MHSLHGTPPTAGLGGLHIALIVIGILLALGIGGGVTYCIKKEKMCFKPKRGSSLGDSRERGDTMVDPIRRRLHHSPTVTSNFAKLVDQLKVGEDHETCIPRLNAELEPRRLAETEPEQPTYVSEIHMVTTSLRNR